MAEIKFCGMTRREDADAAAGLDAAYVGVIFAGGPRQQTVESAQRLFAGLNQAPRRAGVFGQQEIPEIASAVKQLRLDVIQLHANPTVQRIEAVRLATSAKVWAVLQIAGDELPGDAHVIAEVADAIVLDAKVPSGLGGSGVTLPWTQLSRNLSALRGKCRVILAGGLRPENVATAMAALDPDIVDVSSGVESAPGIKDHGRMRAFRDAVAGAGVKK